MARKYILIFLSLFASTLSIGQKTGDYFVSVDSLRSEQFRLLNDSTIEFSPIWRHMSPSMKAVYKYSSTDTAIEITSRQLLETDTLKKGIFIKLPQLKEKLSLKKINGGFIDLKHSIIYVRQKDFGKNPDLTYIIDGKTYFQDAGRTDGYGLIRKKTKTNKALQKRLKGLNKDNCNIEIVKGGLAAYKRFGIKCVYGAFVVSTKK
jgi:hypothetical protein